MLQTAPFFVTFFLYIFRLLFRNPPPKPLRRSLSLSHPYAAVHSGTKTTYHKFTSLRRNDDDHPISPTTAVIIDVEGALLKSTSMFPYFMLVAFEAGSLVRAAVLLLFYPFLRLLTLAGGHGGELELKLMVFISFIGLRQKDFSVGSSVLPRAFLSDVALEAFEAAKGGGGGKVVAVCGKLPRVMVESFLKDYLEVEFVVARELRVVGGYFVGALEEDSGGSAGEVVRAIGGDGDDRPVGIARFSRDLDDHRIFSLCKEIYLVRRADKASWRNLPRDKYPKPLIFHDGRLAAVPTPLSFLALLVWTPFGLLLAAARLAVAITLPYTFSVPILYFSGFRTVITQTATSPPNSSAAAAAAAAETAKKKGQLYVCNHRTLLDPLYLSFTMNRKFTAVTYSLSRVSELLSPIPTVRLNRDRVRDAEMMDRLLGRGDLVVCPEGTTCREPYLLRFSPLFAELTDEVVPVAMDVHVDMFYGTTASGLKCLDPLFFLLNPRPEYYIRVLDPVSTGLRSSGLATGPSRYDVANRVQRRIGDALGFECTKLTRKDKYMALAGNEGIHYNR